MIEFEKQLSRSHSLTGLLRLAQTKAHLPAPATALVLGQLDEDSERDIAVAAGHELILIHGRDRRLSLGERERAAVPPARITGRSLGFAVRAMTDGPQPASLDLLSEDGTIHQLDSGESIFGNTHIEKNVISGNTDFGIDITFAGVILLENYIGVDPTGTFAIPNGGGARLIFCRGLVIGGITADARNVISGNNGDGIVIATPASATIQGNFIGTDVSGTYSIPNTGSGLLVSIETNLTPETLIGGETENAFNLISANGRDGITVGTPIATPEGRNFGGFGIKILRNYIGTDITGELALGNGRYGIYFDNRTYTNSIRRNRIAYNKSSGIFIPNNGSGLGVPGVQNTISENEIFSNASIGIDLGDPGPTANQPPQDSNGALRISFLLQCPFC